MIRPLAILIAAAVLLVAPTPSIASASTCGTHQLAITGWSTQTDTISTSYDFQCGNANHDDYHIGLYLQTTSDGGQTWWTPNCDNGNPCSTQRPTSGYYPYGAERSGTNQWNPAIQINCRPWRFHAIVSFQSGSVAKFTGATMQIGGC